MNSHMQSSILNTIIKVRLNYNCIPNLKDAHIIEVGIV